MFFIYYAKYAYYHLMILFTAFIITPLFAVRPNNFENTRLAAWILRKVCRILNIKWNFKGIEHLWHEEAAILVVNHQSTLDVLGIAEAWKYITNCVIVSKKELLYTTGPLGLIMWISGCIFLDRSNKKSAKLALKKAVNRIIVDKLKVWIFPEGTRNNSKSSLLPFKKGAFHLAIDCQVSIIPIIFSSYANFIDSKQKIFKPGNVLVSVLPPISVKGLTKEDLTDLLNHVYNLMNEIYQTNSAFMKYNSICIYIPIESYTNRLMKRMAIPFHKIQIFYEIHKFK